MSIRVAAATVLLVPVVSGCDLYRAEPRLTVQVDKSMYLQAAPNGPVLIQAVVRNTGDRVAVLQGCDPTLNWDFQQLVNGRWQGRSSGGFACAPPTIVRVDLAPGQSHTDTLDVSLPGSTYRLAVFYQTSPQASDFRVSEPSAPFAIRP